MSENILQKLFQPSARGKIWRTLVFIILLALVGSLIDAGSYYNNGTDWLSNKTGNTVNLPKTKEIPFRLGLDLQGGSHLVYRADVSQVPAADQASALEGVRDVIERRVNVFGVSEPIVQTSFSGGDHRVIVELAGISDVNEAIKMIGETPLLEFKEESDEEPEINDEQAGMIEEINTKAEAKAEEILGKLISGGEFSALAGEFSDDQASKDMGGDMGWITEKDNSFIVNEVKEFSVGQVSEDYKQGPTGYEILKLEDRRFRTNPFDANEIEKEVQASHLLLCYDGIDGCSTGLSKDDTYNKIKDIKLEATPKNFADLVKEHTTEPGGAERGGSLGWFGKGAMVEPFEDAVFEQEVGTISYVVETQFGYHLLYKQDERNIEEFKVGRILIRTASPKDLLEGEQNWKLTELTGKNLKRASVQFNQNDNTPQVSLEFDSEGSDLFAEITERNVGSPVAIFLDGFAISVPTVNEKITGGQAVISGSFNIQEAKLLAQRLNAGALPVPIELISQQTVGASLGKISLEISLKAGLLGLLLVALFMIVYYRLPGVLAVISLCIYGILVLAIFKIIPVTLSLAGLAGFILSIGMAVDANVLIFERLKEELKAGRPLSIAIINAFERAWPSIRDGNVSTIITCLILMWFSTSIVKGFAITLFLGILISMFSAIVITKTLLQTVESEWLEKRLGLLGANKK